jgi:arabinose-5-phosphate isomerase
MLRPAATQKTRAVRSDRASSALQSALRTLDLEREGLAALRAAFAQPLGKAFTAAVAMLAAASGRVIVTGIGKSGHVGQKVAATFASTGTPAFFVHPSEASHGDLGMVTRDDAIVALSWNGEAVELRSIVTYSRRFKVPLIAITSRAQSTLAKQADVVLELPRAKEACPHGLAPTTSTTPRPCRSPSAIASPSRCWSTGASPPRTSRSSTPEGRWALLSSSSPTSCTGARRCRWCRWARPCRRQS